MKYLLDTHIWLWTLLEPDKLDDNIAIKSRLIELPHKDPADRFIAATAWEYDLTLITVDEKLREAEQIKIL